MILAFYEASRLSFDTCFGQNASQSFGDSHSIAGSAVREIIAMANKNPGIGEHHWEVGWVRLRCMEREQALFGRHAKYNPQ